MLSIFETESCNFSYEAVCCRILLMDWESPKLLLLAFPALALLLWFESRSVHPMEGARKKLLLVVRAVGVILVLLALAGPARVAPADRQALGILVDASQSMGEEGLKNGLEQALAVQKNLGPTAQSFIVLFGTKPELLKQEGGQELNKLLEQAQDFQKRNGGDSQYAAAVEYARALFPAGASQSLLLIGDGHETRGRLMAAAQEAGLASVVIHALPLAGPQQPDSRVRELIPSRSRLHEGASLTLAASLESSLDATGTLKLYENGVLVDQHTVSLKAGVPQQEKFVRSPSARDTYRYRAVLETDHGQDALPANNSALALVEVRGNLRLLYLDSDPAEAAYLQQAMAKEGIVLDLRQPGNIPQTLEQLSGYDGIILSDVPAHRVGESALTAMKDYVDKLGGGLVMLGGPNSFALGGYYKTPVDELLPVRLRAPDEEEKQSAAVALVLDRSGSMAGEKLEMAKSASLATAEVLGRNDFIGVYAFDSEAHVVAPMTRLTSTAVLSGQIATVAAGGGTNLQPAFEQARDALRRVKAKVRHMIILSDGQTSGSGYESLAAQCRGEGLTVSTVSIGEGSHVGLMQAIASGGGGQAYTTLDASGISRIFTQDTLMHTGRMLREEPFLPVLSERHPMLAGFETWKSPDLLGYVKTLRKPAAQMPLVTDTGEPLLAHWRFGLGKVTAFTSDARSRWASLWIARWADFGRFWSQVIRETARPPQGRNMDLSVAMRAEDALLKVDLMADAGSRANDARVQAEVFFVAADSLGASMEQLHQVTLGQSAPGLYEGVFRPEEPGVYLVRARSGADMVSSGVVYNPAGEVSLGTVNETVFSQSVAAASGSVLTAGQQPDLSTSRAVLYQEMWPAFLIAALLLFLVDIAVRRWEHVLGLVEVLRPGNRK